jgi:hypothetical protein
MVETPVKSDDDDDDDDDEEEEDVAREAAVVAAFNPCKADNATAEVSSILPVVLLALIVVVVVDAIFDWYGIVFTSSQW